MKRPYFYNVDLDIESKFSLRSLTVEFGDSVHVLFSGRMKGRHCLYVEIAGASRNQNAILNSLCDLVEGLSEKSRQVWNEAQKKEFNLGYEMRLSSERSNRFEIRPSTLRRIANIGASVAVTIYREETNGDAV